MTRATATALLLAADAALIVLAFTVLDARLMLVGALTATTAMRLRVMWCGR